MGLSFRKIGKVMSNLVQWAKDSRKLLTNEIPTVTLEEHYEALGNFDYRKPYSHVDLHHYISPFTESQKTSYFNEIKTFISKPGLSFEIETKPVGGELGYSEAQSHNDITGYRIEITGEEGPVLKRSGGIIRLATTDRDLVTDLHNDIAEELKSSSSIGTIEKVLCRVNKDLFYEDIASRTHYVTDLIELELKSKREKESVDKLIEKLTNMTPEEQEAFDREVEKTMRDISDDDITDDPGFYKPLDGGNLNAL